MAMDFVGITFWNQKRKLRSRRDLGRSSAWYVPAVFLTASAYVILFSDFILRTSSSHLYLGHERSFAEWLPRQLGHVLSVTVHKAQLCSSPHLEHSSFPLQ